MAKFNEKQNALMYRIYVTDCLEHTVNNLARHRGGFQVERRYFDIYQTLNNPDDVEIRTSGEIINHIRNKLNDLKDEE